jgi:mannose-6-phosphate isomerase
MGAVKRQDEGRVEKPWGYEDRWAITDRYLGKILHIDAGQALSLQYHNAKDECILIVRGLMDLELDDDSGELVNYRLTEGDTVHITPGRKHRMTAVTDTDVFEVSTPEIDDVVRLEDRYGRSGP